MSRVLAYPVLTAALVLVWMLLNSFSVGQFLLGTAIAATASQAMAALQPAKPRLRRWPLIPWLVAVVIKDILQSNLAVATIILKNRGQQRASGFVAIPLELRDK